MATHRCGRIKTMVVAGSVNFLMKKRTEKVAVEASILLPDLMPSFVVDRSRARAPRSRTRWAWRERAREETSSSTSLFLSLHLLSLPAYVAAGKPERFHVAVDLLTRAKPQCHILPAGPGVRCVIPFFSRHGLRHRSRRRKPVQIQEFTPDQLLPLQFT
jgi:hypothetical protein